MRKILAMVAVVTLLVLGGVSGVGLQTGHAYNPTQLAADGDNGSGG